MGSASKWTAIASRFAHLLRIHWAIVLVVFVFAGVEYAGIRLTKLEQKYRHQIAETATYSPLAVRGLPRTMQDQVLYRGVASSLADGNMSIVPGDGYIYEYRDTATPQPPLTVGLTSVGIKVFGGPDAAFDAARVSSVAGIALLTYIVAFAAVGGVLTPLVAAVAVPLYWSAGEIIPFMNGRTLLDPVGLVEWFGTSIPWLGQFNRLPYSGLTFPVLMAGIGAVAWAVKRPSIASTVVAGVLIGAQAVTYPYYSTSWAVGLPLLIVWYAASRDWRAAGVIVAACGIAVIAGSPAFVAQYEVSHLAQYEDILARVGKFNTSFDWTFVYRGLAVLVLVGAGRWVRELLTPAYVTAAAVAFGGVMCLNLNMVTGIDLQSWHWIDRVTYPLMAFLGALFAGKVARRIVVAKTVHSRWRVTAPVLAAVIVTFGLARHVEARITTYQYWSRYEAVPTDHLDAYRWLDRHDAEVTLALNAEQIRLMRIYAGSYTYLPNAATSVIPHEETIERFVAAARYCGLTESTFSELIGLSGGEVLYNDLPPEASADAPPWLFERSQLHEVLFHHRYRKVGGEGKPYVFPDSVKQDMMARFHGMDDPEVALRRYRVDYIWQGPFECAMGIDSLENERHVEPAFAIGRIRLYRVLDTPPEQREH